MCTIQAEQGISITEARDLVNTKYNQINQPPTLLSQTTPLSSHNPNIQHRTYITKPNIPNTSKQVSYNNSYGNQPNHSRTFAGYNCQQHLPPNMSSLTEFPAIHGQVLPTTNHQPYQSM